MRCTQQRLPTGRRPSSRKDAYCTHPSVWLGSFFVLHWILFLGVVPALSTEGPLEQVSLIVNGGDAPPRARLEFLAVDDPRQLGPGDAVAHITGSGEELLTCTSVRIELLEIATAGARRPCPGGRLGKAQRIQADRRPSAQGTHATRRHAGLRCSMWVRRMGTDRYPPTGLHTRIGVRRSPERTSLIVTLALKNAGDRDFYGGFRLINVLPEALEFGHTLAVEEWLRTGDERTDPHRGIGSTAGVPAPPQKLRKKLPRNAIAFQEHLHGQTVIFQAKGVRIIPGAAVAVDYIVTLRSS